MDLPIALWTTFVAVISSPSGANSNYVQISTYDDSLPTRETRQRGGVEDDFRTTRGECSTLQSMMNYKLGQQFLSFQGNVPQVASQKSLHVLRSEEHC